MSNTNGVVNLRNISSSSSKQSSFLLPPRSPFPTVSPSYIDPGTIGSKPNPNPNPNPRSREAAHQRHPHHYRNASESFVIEEQPSWLDDLLNEPETPVRRGAHRRSSSDSFTYFDGANIYGSSLDGFNWVGGVGSIESNSYQHEPNLAVGRGQNGRPWERHVGPHRQKDKGVVKGADVAPSDLSGKKEKEESAGPDQKGVKHSQSEADNKRAKQQYAQRSRVRKLQYIAELERKVQALQAEGIEVSAEMEFLSQQNIMLDLENKALKQRLESLAQEQLIKHFQQEMFEREIGRLRQLYQQQQMQQQPQQQPQSHPATHNRAGSRDLDSQFANLSLNNVKHNNNNNNNKDPNPGREPINGPLRI